MQEEVNEKTISLCIKGGKITAQILKAALIKLLAEMDKKKKQQEKGKGQCKRTGKQSINQAVTVLQTLVIALGAGLAVWGVVNLMEGYGNDNPGANAHVR